MSDKRKSNNLFISFGLVSRLSHSIPWLRRKRNISWSLNQNLSRSHFFLAKTNNIGETETVDWDWIVKPKCNSQIQNYKRKIKGMELGLSPNQTLLTPNLVSSSIECIASGLQEFLEYQKYFFQTLKSRNPFPSVSKVLKTWSQKWRVVIPGGKNSENCLKKWSKKDIGVEFCSERHFICFIENLDLL